MKKICFIDDQSYGIPQIINAIPQNIEYKFYYYDRISDIEDIEFDLVILDFYLDKDRKTALDVIERFLGTIIIGFSSVESKNELIIQNGGIYAAQKLQKTNENKELTELFNRIL